eukprot:TRINITY_DN6960_c0_g3_i1.p1 TRINITY_DN6960_c0_g3~~TRINITY_DN6960_c0_g3_i1.p1  ORF type:complete len:189 (+),score=38.13 TRINITY_DN6960_c0_g3_i1:32-568(+)
MEFCFKTKVSKTLHPNTKITNADFVEFWSWFGIIVQKVRFHKCLLPMWQKGLFWGFITKERANLVLKPFPAGTFLLRFSIKNSGSIAVAYKQTNLIVRHYMMKTKDTMENSPSLPLFVRDAAPLLQFLCVEVTDNLHFQIHSLEKHAALSKLCFKKPKIVYREEADSYDRDLLELETD